MRTVPVLVVVFVMALIIIVVVIIVMMMLLFGKILVRPFAGIRDRRRGSRGGRCLVFGRFGRDGACHSAHNGVF